MLLCWSIWLRVQGKSLEGLALSLSRPPAGAFGQLCAF